jgi:enterochelin esterase-like enzyme
LLPLVSALFLACAQHAPPPAPASPAPPPVDENTSCDSAGENAPICRLATDDLTEAAARASLGEREVALVREGDTATILARSRRDEATLCCFVTAPMLRVGGDIWAARYRMRRLDEASLAIIPPDLLGQSFSDSLVLRWRGPVAPPAPDFEAEIEGGELERTLWSDALGETRKLFIYLPPHHDRTRAYPALFMADGGSVGYFARIVEPLIDQGVIEPIVIVGAESGQEGIVEDRSTLGIPDLRNADYLPHFSGGADRFEQHMRFFAGELVAYAARELAVSDQAAHRVVAGFSSGGSFALYAGLRRPDIFGAAIPMSPSWRPLAAEDFHPSHRARFYISAGLYEMRRANRARAYAEELTQRGFDVVAEYPAMGHTSDQSGLVLSRALPRFFPPSDADAR